VLPVATARIPFLPPPPPSPPVTVISRAASRSLWGRHVWRTAGWYAGASLAETDASEPATLPTSSSMEGGDVSSRSLELGKYVGLSTAVELSLEAAETALRSEIPLFCASMLCSPISSALITTTLETNLESIEVSALHVGRLGRMRYSLSGGISASELSATIDIVATALTLATLPTVPAFVPARPPTIAGGVAVGGVYSDLVASGARERNQRYALAGELFPTQGLGIRLGYSRWDGDEPLGETYELDATWFFKPSIGARVALSRAKSDLPVSTIRDVDAVALQLIGRL
jgi:hypothetical protein